MACQGPAVEFRPSANDMLCELGEYVKVLTVARGCGISDHLELLNQIMHEGDVFFCDDAVGEEFDVPGDSRNVSTVP